MEGRRKEEIKTGRKKKRGKEGNKEKVYYETKLKGIMKN